MRLDKDKKVGLIITAFMMITAPIFFYLTDGTKPIKKELNLFYQAELNNETITSIIERPYTGGRGNYKLFTTNVQSQYRPILIENYYEDIQFFKVGGKITKRKDSYYITLADNDNEHKIKIQNPLNDTLFDTFMPIGFFGLFFLIQLFIIPNSYYENRRTRNQKSKYIKRN